MMDIIVVIFVEKPHTSTLKIIGHILKLLNYKNDRLIIKLKKNDLFLS